MCWLYFNSVVAGGLIIRQTTKYFSLFFILVIINSCGKAYFPIELKTISRAERSKGQEKNIVQLVPLTAKSTSEANSYPYRRKVIVADDLTKAAKLIPVDQAIIEKFPKNNDPGPYIIGIGDTLSVSEILSPNSSVPTFVTREIAISDDGFINIYGLGSLQAAGLTQSELEDRIYQKLIEVKDLEQWSFERF